MSDVKDDDEPYGEPIGNAANRTRYTLPDGMPWWKATDGASIGRRWWAMKQKSMDFFFPRAIAPELIEVPDGYVLDPKTGEAKALGDDPRAERGLLPEGKKRP